jgi:hypothetical protein
VWVYVAVVKLINGRRYIDALKGFLIDKESPKTPLENPCVVTLNLENPNYLQPEHYQ